jgi:hypothetical protein
LLAASAALPPAASAHGLSGRADLPIPAWLFIWTACAVLVLSFVALGVLWKRAKLEGSPVWTLPAWCSRAVTSTATEVVCGAIGVFLLGFGIWAGLFGSQSTVDNVLPTFVYVAFWVGLVPVSVAFGNVFRAFDPWRAAARAASFAAARLLGDRLGQGMPYPERLGRWPAAAGLLAFVWLELLAPNGAEPRTLAAAAIVYSSVTFLGMGVYGIEPWTERGEAFSVYFDLFSRLSPFERQGGEIVLRVPLAGLTLLRADTGLVGVLAVMIGSVTFDGLQETGFWSEVGPSIATFFDDLGTNVALGDELAGGVGLLACIALVGLFYVLGCAGARTAGRGLRTLDLARLFVHSLVPIALVYVMAHYLTFMLFQGQALIPLSSDPAGRGWDLLGTAGSQIDYGLISSTVTWYVQVAFVVAGHVSALALAHDRALVTYPEPRLAVRSQYWMLLVMVGFTSLALWLLSQANA